MSDIKKKLQAIDRRTFLKGVGNIMISLPVLDFMFHSSGEVLAATGSIPLRYLVVANGLSIGGAGSSTDINQISNFNPSNTGANWIPSLVLSPILDYPGLKPYINVISNLSIPYTGNQFNNGPKFGIDTDFHNYCSRIQLTGLNAGEKGASSDQLLYTNLNLGNHYIHLNYSVQPKSYTGSGSDIMQYNVTGSPQTALIDPAQAFATMVTGIQTVDTAANALRLAQLKKRKSVLDLIDKRRVDYLKKIMGAEAKTSLSNYFDKLRELEIQVDADIQNTSLLTSSCKMTTQPSAVPLGSDYIGVPEDNTITGNMGWSDELQRSQLFRDIIAMGFSCDRSRTGTLRLTNDQSFISAQKLIGEGKGSGKAKDYHEITHGRGTLEDLSLCTAWHIREFFKLAESLRNIQEGANTVLDNTVLLFLSEGGYGYMSDKSAFTPHSGDNMAILTAGRAGGLPSGNHIKADKEHPGEVIFSAMKSVGYSGTNFNKITKSFSVLK